MASSDMQDVKRRIKSVTSMEHITNAMKLVSAAKLRKAKATYESTNQYFHYITHSIEEIFNNADKVPQRYLAGNREIKTTCYIIITGSRGLCGAFNGNVIKEAEREMKADWEEPLIVAIGSKGNEYFKKRDYNIYKSYTAPAETIPFLETQEMSKPIIEMYNKGEIDEVVLLYTSYISQMEQQVMNITLLPFEVEPDPEILKHHQDVEYEPSVEDVFNYLVPKYVEIMVYGAIVESATCEHAARRMAMENATDNARAMLDDLSLYYNRARQSAITNEIIEIVSGSEAQK
ncbi:MAG: ATP synthase F1 subunit gamma [Eubacteriaceae bacterium]|nr:ATP synthase F1 subunit gamma [Eubacteriaceae bacterium]